MIAELETNVVIDGASPTGLMLILVKAVIRCSGSRRRAIGPSGPKPGSVGGGVVGRPPSGVSLSGFPVRELPSASSAVSVALMLRDHHKVLPAMIRGGLAVSSARGLRGRRW